MLYRTGVAPRAHPLRLGELNSRTIAVRPIAIRVAGVVRRARRRSPPSADPRSLALEQSLALARLACALRSAAGRRAAPHGRIAPRERRAGSGSGKVASSSRRLSSIRLPSRPAETRRAADQRPAQQHLANPRFVLSVTPSMCSTSSRIGKLLHHHRRERDRLRRFGAQLDPDVGGSAIDFFTLA